MLCDVHSFKLIMVDSQPTLNNWAESTMSCKQQLSVRARGKVWGWGQFCICLVDHASV